MSNIQSNIETQEQSDAPDYYIRRKNTPLPKSGMKCDFYLFIAFVPNKVEAMPFN